MDRVCVRACVCVRERERERKEDEGESERKQSARREARRGNRQNVVVVQN